MSNQFINNNMKNYQISLQSWGICFLSAFKKLKILNTIKNINNSNIFVFERDRTKQRAALQKDRRKKEQADRILISINSSFGNKKLSIEMFFSLIKYFFSALAN